jgi:hypothetical protein
MRRGRGNGLGPDAPAEAIWPNTGRGNMAKGAFDKIIKAGLGEAMAYLDESATDRGYDALRDYLKKQSLAEFVLSFEQIEEIIDAALPRAAHRASWWETLRSPQEKMPQRQACLAGGYIATRQADGKSVRFKKFKS